MENIEECFVIMPISEVDGYDEENHFEQVYKYILKKAIENAGYKAIRADEISSSNIIQKDILQRLIESPMVICDLSTLNPNVMFELGIRQAFNKPTVYIQEEGNRRIFDVSLIRTHEYKPKLSPQNVEDAIKNIELVLLETKSEFNKTGVSNSLIHQLGITMPNNISARKLEQLANMVDDNGNVVANNFILKG